MFKTENGELMDYYYVDNYMVSNSDASEVGDIEESTLPPQTLYPLIPCLGNVPLIKKTIKPHTASTKQVVANCLYFKFPAEFMSSENAKKRVRLDSCHVFTLDESGNLTENDASIHSDLAQYRSGVDNYITQANPSYFVKKEYPVSPQQSFFRVWFRDKNGSIIDLAPLVGECHFVIEFTIIY